jgi:hypothetical protein
MKKTKIVTALYTDSTTKTAPYFGHVVLAREERYFHSLRTLNNMDTEIICYCNETQYEQIVNHINTFNLNNVTVKISNLWDSKYAQRMKEIKEKDERFNFYHEIDWNKIYLLEKEYDESYDYIYWIDVGLSHHGLFPNRFHPNSELISGMSYDYNTYSFTKIFKQDFINGLNLFLEDSLLTINNNTIFHPVSDLNEILEDTIYYNGLTVGGILGGHISKLRWFTETFNTLGEKSLDKNFILNHEPIISYIKEKTPENFKSFNFDTWYHEDSHNIPDYVKGMVSFSNFFDLIYDNYVNYKENSLR